MDCWLLILTHQVPQVYFRTSLLISKQSTKHSYQFGIFPTQVPVKICENPSCGLRFCLTFFSWIFSQSKMAIQRKCIPIPTNLHFLYAPCCLFWLFGNLKKISLYHGSFGFIVGFYMFLNVTSFMQKPPFLSRPFATSPVLSLSFGPKSRARNLKKKPLREVIFMVKKNRLPWVADVKNELY